MLPTEIDQVELPQTDIDNWPLATLGLTMLVGDTGRIGIVLMPYGADLGGRLLILPTHPLVRSKIFGADIHRGVRVRIVPCRHTTSSIPGDGTGPFIRVTRVSTRSAVVSVRPTTAAHCNEFRFAWGTLCSDSEATEV